MENGNAWAWDGVLLSYTGGPGKASLIGNLRKVRELAMWEGKVQRTWSRSMPGVLKDQQRPVCSSSLDEDQSSRRRSQREEGLMLRHLLLLP